MTTYAEWTREIAPERNAMHHTVTKIHPPRHRHDSETSADPRTADATTTTRRRCKSLSRDQLSEPRDASHHHHHVHHTRDEEEDAEDNYSTVMPQQRSLSSSRVQQQQQQQQQQQTRHSTSPSDGMILTPSGLAYPINQHGLAYPVNQNGQAYPGNPNTSTFQSRIAVTGRGQPGLHVSGSHPHYRSQQQLHHQHQQQQQQLYSQYHYQPDLYLSTAT